MAIFSHINMHLNAYTILKYIYTPFFMHWHAYLCFYAHVYMYIYVYMCILACIWSHPTSLLPAARRVAHNTKGATQKCQIQVQHWPDITVLSVSSVS